jgi:uncharacterized RDD family membrane protein YckC
MTNAPPPPNWVAQAPGLPALPGDPVGFWIRVVAAIVDWLILCLIVGVLVGIVIALIAVFGGRHNDLAVGLGVAIGIIAIIVAGWLYEAILTSSERGATYGKQMIGARIVGAGGGRISFGRATARHFLKVIITPLIPFGVGYWMAGFTRGKRALHDFMADTFVVRNYR